jgi:hypothetical protein
MLVPVSGPDNATGIEVAVEVGSDSVGEAAMGGTVEVETSVGVLKLRASQEARKRLNPKPTHSICKYRDSIQSP